MRRLCQREEAKASLRTASTSHAKRGGYTDSRARERERGQPDGVQAIPQKRMLSDRRAEIDEL